MLRLTVTARNYTFLIIYDIMRYSSQQETKGKNRSKGNNLNAM